jgi:hypothetical protein
MPYQIVQYSTVGYDDVDRGKFDNERAEERRRVGLSQVRVEAKIKVSE